MTPEKEISREKEIHRQISELYQKAEEFKEKNDLRSAEQCYEETAKLWKETGNTRGVAEDLFQAGKIEEARRYFLELAEKYKAARHPGATEAYLKAGEIEKAKAIWREETGEEIPQNIINYYSIKYLITSPELIQNKDSSTEKEGY